MSGHAAKAPMVNQDEALMQLTLQLKNKNAEKGNARFHGDNLIGNWISPKVSWLEDLATVIQPRNLPALKRIIDGLIKGNGLDKNSFAIVAGSLSDYSPLRKWIIDQKVKGIYDKMLHPPLTYLGDAFRYRSADGKFNSAINPHLGQAGAPYARTVPSKTAPLGALPDPSDLFDKLMARVEGGRESQSGLSTMLIYHATIIIHDIFRTNDSDKNISDRSSYLDLSPLYGFTKEMQRKIRDDKYKLGLLKPDTFAEDRLLRQPPGVCIMLVMYNRYHNYAARQLLRINEDGRFTVPKLYAKTKLVSVIQELLPNRDVHGRKEDLDAKVRHLCDKYEVAWREAEASRPREAPAVPLKQPQETPANKERRETAERKREEALDAIARFEKSAPNKELIRLTRDLESLLDGKKQNLKKESPQKHEEFEIQRRSFETAWEAAWDKQDDDLFNTARLITCGMYIQISVHDYLRALMGFHQFDTNFTLDPRADFDQKKTSRGIGNQVTVEFNLLYRFHCAISLKDESYAEEYMQKTLGFENPRDTSLPVFLQTMAANRQKTAENTKKGIKAPEPWEVTFGIPDVSGPSQTKNESYRALPDGGLQSDNDSDSGVSDDGSDSGISMYGNDSPGTPKKTGSSQANGAGSKLFARNSITNLFDDRQMLAELTSAMDDPISNFGPRNVPKCLKAVEIMGILQARKWEIGTLNDFRDFFGLPRHANFQSVSKNVDIQNALRDLYEHPDKIELYPGIFCESDEHMSLDPGPQESGSALWTAIFSDAITLVRSDRFYTVDWNTNSLTSWGMKEVTPNNEICKSSVFHRLIQRAFPGWFPPDTVRFFHPFYTTKQNAVYAQGQGYGTQFRETAKKQSKPYADVANQLVQKPPKPRHFETFHDISIVLQGQQSGNFTNPAYRSDDTSLPQVVKDVLNPDRKWRPISPALPKILEDHVKGAEKDLQRYLDELMRDIVKRESISVTNSTFQIDATRDFAVPVVTQCVADFLGFGDKITAVDTKFNKTYSENEIFQHITNCHVFLTYDADETKWMQRRRAFKASMKLLIDLAQEGTIWEANQWRITRTLFGKRQKNAMHKLGVFVANQILSYERDHRKAAVALLLICLDFAYNGVVSFTATLDGYMAGLDEAANSNSATASPKPKWTEVQEWAFSTASDAESNLAQEIQKTARETVRLPILRKANVTARYDFTRKTKKGKKPKIKKGAIVLLDLSKAILKAEADGDEAKVRFLTSQLGIADKYGAFAPRRFATLALTSMITFVAQMKNPRRGHDAQGRLKKIRLGSTREGYANYMAPMRVRWIKQQAKQLKRKEAKKIFTDDVLNPETDTYLTPTWDEFVPFPMTWKIRFDGFGRSDYKVADNPYGLVKAAPPLPDSIPPWYQPQGPSTVGGAFATECVDPSEKKMKPEIVSLSTGCGLSDNHAHMNR